MLDSTELAYELAMDEMAATVCEDTTEGVMSAFRPEAVASLATDEMREEIIAEVEAAGVVD